MNSKANAIKSAKPKHSCGWIVRSFSASQSDALTAHFSSYKGSEPSLFGQGGRQDLAVGRGQRQIQQPCDGGSHICVLDLAQLGPWFNARSPCDEGPSMPGQVLSGSVLPPDSPPGTGGAQPDA